MNGKRRLGKAFKTFAAITALALLATLVRLPVASASSTPDTNWYTSAPGVTIYQIDTADELAGLAELVNAGNDFNGKTIELSGTIDLASYNWTPIGTSNTPFQGTFDGGAYVISGLTISETLVLSTSDTRRVGLFGVIGHEGTVQNVELTGVNINVAYTPQSIGPDVAFVGSVTGMNEGTVAEVTVTGTLSVTGGDVAVGGVVGSNGSNRSVNNYGGLINASSAAVSINAASNYQVLQVGGLVGISTKSGSQIVDSYSEGTISANGAGMNGSPSAGGLVGYADRSSISGSWSSATVTNIEGKDTSYAGGLVGSAIATIIDNSYATGNVYLSLRSNAVSSNVTAAGGLVGYLWYASALAKIVDSHSAGNVTVEAQAAYMLAAGGLVGYSRGGAAPALIERSYATGDASATWIGSGPVFTGGLAGYAWGTSIDQSYSTGNAYSRSDGATGNAGSGGLTGVLVGLSGTVTSSISNSYSTGKAQADSAGQERVGGLVGLASTNSNISSSYSTGVPHVVQGVTVKRGGSVGQNSGNAVAHTYYDTTASRQTDTLNGMPLNTGEMTEPNALQAAQSGSLSGLTGGVWTKRPHATTVEGRVVEVYYPELAVFAGSSASAEAQAASKASVTTAVYANLTHEGVTTYFGSIQGAIDAAADGDTVGIAPGVHTEQLTVTKNITLEGAGIDQTILVSPDSDKLMPSAWTNLKDQQVYAVVGVKTGSPGQVAIRNLTIDGRKQGYIAQHNGVADLYTFSGIAVRDTSATIDRVRIVDVRDTHSDYSGAPAPLPSDYVPQDQPSGANHNESILLEGAAGTGAHKVTVQDSEILRFHKTAILAWGPALEVDIRNNTIQGHGRTLYSTGNGIQVASSDRSSLGGGNGDRRGTSGIVQNNRITDIGLVIPEPGQVGSYLNLGLYGPSGILLWEAADGFVIEGNTITGPSVPAWHNSATSNDGGYSNDGIGLNYSKNVTVRNNVIAGFGTAILEGSSVTGSSLEVSDNTLSGNEIDIWASSGADSIKLGAGAETIAYGENTNGTDTIEGFGSGDRIRVIGFRSGSVNGQIGTPGNAIYVNDTGGTPIINGYADGAPVVDFTGGTVTSGDGTVVAARSVQVAVSGQVTTLYIDTENDADVPELELKLAGVYSPLNFKLNGGDIEYFDPFATVLFVTAADPSGSSNDGKTKLTVTPAVTDAAHKLVYFNFGGGVVIVPSVGQTLTDYSDLPANGLIAAANGDKIGVAEVDASGKLVKFGQVVALVTAEPSTNTPSTPSSGSSGGGTPLAEDEGFVVLVNGKKESAGQATTTESGGVKTTTIVVDTAKLLEKLRAAGEGAVVTIPVGVAANVIVAELDGQIIEKMTEASATLVIKTPKASYTVPAEQLGIGALSGRLGTGVKPDQVKMHISIADVPSSMAATVAAAAADGGFTLVLPPLDFKISASYGGRTVEVSKFGAFVERTVALPDGIDSDKITTGIVVERDGSFRHVPTKIAVIDGTYHAAINSLTNSVYAVVWHPVEFADVQGHWAKDAINDMGSRMVISGVSDTSFDPGADITRAEFAAMVVRGLGLKPDEGEQTFRDVAAESWYADIVRTAAAYGLVQGFKDGTFRPTDKITREEAMMIAAKAMRLTGLADKTGALDNDAVLSKFADGADAAVWAKEAIASTAKAELISGRNGGKLEPKANISRAEVAVLIQRLLQRSGLI